MVSDDIVEAHCYFVNMGRTDREQICSRINNNDCRTFRLRRPLSTAYRTDLMVSDMVFAFVVRLYMMGGGGGIVVCCTKKQQIPV